MTVLTRSSSGLLTSSCLLTSDRFITVNAHMKQNKHSTRPTRRGVILSSLERDALIVTSQPSNSQPSSSTITTTTGIIIRSPSGTPQSLNEVPYVSDKMYARVIESSDRMVRPPLSRNRISNCTHLFRPEPNRTRHRMFTCVSLLFGNLYRPKCCTDTFTVRRRYI